MHDLQRLLSTARCRAFGCEDASNDAQRLVLTALIQGFDHPEATVLCEPSLARSGNLPPARVGFNATDFRRGLAFRFQCSATGWIGNPEGQGEQHRRAPVAAR